VKEWGKVSGKRKGRVARHGGEEENEEKKIRNFGKAETEDGIYGEGGKLHACGG